MYSVTEDVKKLFRDDGTRKHYVVKFTGTDVTIDNSGIVAGSLEINEAIQTGTDLQFVGCIASSLSVKLSGVPGKIVQGSPVKVYTYLTNYDNVRLCEDIPIFIGLVDSVEIEEQRDYKTVKAYDAFYRMSKIDISDWYNDHETDSGMTMEGLLKEVISKCGLSLETKDFYMYNGSVVVHFGKYRTVSGMTALSLVKNICQINGAFGRINRNGKFELVYHKFKKIEDDWTEVGGEYQVVNTLYPSYSIVPRNTLLPGKNVDYVKPIIPHETIHETIKFQNYDVDPIDYIIIRESSSDSGHTYPTESDYSKNEFETTYGKNKYIVQGNLFTFDRDEDAIRDMAFNLWALTCDMSYTPFESTGIGLPYLECGDAVKYTVDEKKGLYKVFYILSRTLKGDQRLQDSYTAEGNKYKTEYLSDVSITTTKKDDDGLTASTVEEVPEEYKENHIYFIVDSEDDAES